MTLFDWLLVVSVVVVVVSMLAGMCVMGGWLVNRMFQMETENGNGQAVWDTSGADMKLTKPVNRTKESF